VENIGRFGKLKIIGLDQGFLKNPPRSSDIYFNASARMRA